MEKDKIEALLKAFRILLEAELIDLDSIRPVFKAPKDRKQGEEPRESDQSEE